MESSSLIHEESHRVISMSVVIALIFSLSTPGISTLHAEETDATNVDIGSSPTTESVSPSTEPMPVEPQADQTTSSEADVVTVVVTPNTSPSSNTDSETSSEQTPAPIEDVTEPLPNPPPIAEEPVVVFENQTSTEVTAIPEPLDQVDSVVENSAMPTEPEPSSNPDISETEETNTTSTSVENGENVIAQEQPDSTSPETIESPTVTPDPPAPEVSEPPPIPEPVTVPEEEPPSLLSGLFEFIAEVLTPDAEPTEDPETVGQGVSFTMGTSFIPEPLTERRVHLDMTPTPDAPFGCRSETFLVDVSGQRSTGFRLMLEGQTPEEALLEIGDLPSGIDVTFDGTNTYVRETAEYATSVDLHVVNQEGAQQGSFIVPVAFSSDDTRAVCQINIVNQ